MSCLSNAEEPKIHASKQHRSDSHTAPGRRGSFGGICGGLGRRKEMAEMTLADLRDRLFRALLLHLLKAKAQIRDSKMPIYYLII